MDYTGIFAKPPMDAFFLSSLQTATLFILVLAGLKFVGRRVFGEKSPQDLVLLMLIAEACGFGLADQRAGYWGTVASVLTILVLGWICEKTPFLRQLIEAKPIVLFRDGRLDRKGLEKHMLDESDLDTVAREYGLSTYHEFSKVILEGDGQITGVLASPAKGAITGNAKGHRKAT